MTRSSLNDNYVIGSPTTLTTIEAFGNLSDWTPNSGTATADTTNVKYGTQSINLVNTTPGTAAYINKTVNINFGEFGYLDWWVWVEDYTKVSGIQIYLSYNNLASYAILQSFTVTKNGWNHIQLPKSQWDASGGLSLSGHFVWDKAMTQLRVRVSPVAAQTYNISFNRLSICGKTKPKCLITFDDGYTNVIDVAYPIMEAYGIKGTVYEIADYPTNGINKSNIALYSGVMSISDLTTLYADGWDIAGHTYNHGYLAPQAITTNMSSGNPIVTGGFYNGQLVGQTVTGTGIPANTTVIDVASEEVTLSNAPTVTNATASLTYTCSDSVIEDQINNTIDWLTTNGFIRSAHHMAYPFGSYNANVETIATSCGILTARTTVATAFFPPADVNTEIPALIVLNNTITLASFISSFNAAIQAGKTVVILGHDVVAVPANGDQISTTVFQSIIDYIHYSCVDCVTISEWYNGLTNPRRTVSR